jgi:hypothetical protein
MFADAIQKQEPADICFTVRYHHVSGLSETRCIQEQAYHQKVPAKQSSNDSSAVADFKQRRQVKIALRKDVDWQRETAAVCGCTKVQRIEKGNKRDNMSESTALQNCTLTAREIR